MEQGKGPSPKIVARDCKVDDAFMSIRNLQSSMDAILSMQNVFKKPLEQEAQVCESQNVLFKRPLE